jgi:Family of unknown function (DUF5908)
VPIEIKELHIRVEVSPAPGGSPSASGGAPPLAPGADLDSVVALCVEQVMQVLRDRRER